MTVEVLGTDELVILGAELDRIWCRVSYERGWLFNAHLWGGLFIVASGERDE